jgi:hypothetical protein
MRRTYDRKVVRNRFYKGMQKQFFSIVWLLEEGGDVPFSR